MSPIASQITGVSIVCSTVCSGAYQIKHQSSTSLAFVRGIHQWPVDSPHKGPVMRKIFPFDDVIMSSLTGSSPTLVRLCTDLGPALHWPWSRPYTDLDLALHWSWPGSTLTLVCPYTDLGLALHWPWSCPTLTLARLYTDFGLALHWPWPALHWPWSGPTLILVWPYTDLGLALHWPWSGPTLTLVFP